jgi:hypothetical protein
MVSFASLPAVSIATEASDEEIFQPIMDVIASEQSAPSFTKLKEFCGYLINKLTLIKQKISMI